MKIIENVYTNPLLEQEILADLILNNRLVDVINDIMKTDDFFYTEHKVILNYILNNAGNYSITTLKDFFKQNEVLVENGGLELLNQIIHNASHILDIRAKLIKLKELASKRETFFIFNQAIQKLAELKTDQVINEAQNELDKVATLDGENINVFTGEDLEKDWKNNLEKKQDPIETGLYDVDKMLNGGLYQSELYVLGAAAGCGKTFFSQMITLNALKKNKVCVFISIEMPKKALYSRFISIISKINAFRIRVGNIFKSEESGFINSTNLFCEISKNLFVTEKSPITVLDIESVVKRVNKKTKINLLVVDYAQIIRLREDRNLTEASLIKENVHHLANIARKYNIAVLLLSQLTKDKIEGKAGLSAFKGSAGLYEDADVAMTMWDDGNTETPQIKNLRLDIVKNRNGLTGENHILFDGSIGQFSINKNIF